MLNFENLQNKYGYVIAHSILFDLERHLRLNSTELAEVDTETRLQNAFMLMDQISVGQVAQAN